MFISIEQIWDQCRLYYVIKYRSLLDVSMIYVNYMYAHGCECVCTRMCLLCAWVCACVGVILLRVYISTQTHVILWWAWENMEDNYIPYNAILDIENMYLNKCTMYNV